MADGALAVAQEVVDVGAFLPSSVGGEPARRGEVVEGDARSDAVLVATGQHAPVVIERRDREVTPFRLDAGPLDREAVGLEAELAQQARCPRDSGESASQASPDGSANKLPGVCSSNQKSLWVLLPSTWCAAVAVPQMNPSGKRNVMRGTLARPACGSQFEP